MKQQMPSLGVWFGKTQSLLLSIVVLASLAAPAIIHIAGRSTDTTSIDNHRPAPFPKWPKSFANIERFRNRLVDHVTENFGLRAELIWVNVRLHKLFGLSSVPMLLLGKNNWFFLRSINDVFDQYRGINRFTEAELDTWIDHMEVYRDWLAERGIKFMVMIAPNQQTIYPEYMPDYATRAWPETRLDQVVRRLRERNSSLVLYDFRPDLFAAREKGILYFRAESHWNVAASFIAYSRIMGEIEKLFPRIQRLVLADFDIGSHDIDWGILGVIDPQPTYALKKPTKVVSTEVVGSMNGIPIERNISSLDAAPGVLVYGDSFFASDLLDFFKETFRSTIFVASNQTSIPLDLIEKYHPDIVIYELVERYLPRSLDIAGIESENLIRKAPPLSTMLASLDGKLGGFIDHVEVKDGGMGIGGWAVNAGGNGPTKTVYAYLGALPVGATTPTDPRPDVAKDMADKNVGFHMTLETLKRPAAGDTLRFFSVDADGSAHEVLVHPDIAQPAITKFLKALP